MLDIRITGDVVHLSGRFDGSQVEKADRVFAGLVRSTTVDLRDLEYISSSAIAVLVHAHDRLRGGGHELRVRNPKEAVRNILRLAGLDRVLPME